MQKKICGLRIVCLVTMKLLIALTIIASLPVSARSFGQTITLHLKDAPLEEVFKQVNQQSGYSFIYTRDQLKHTIPVTIKVQKAGIKEVLNLCFQNQPLSFVLEDPYIIVQTKVLQSGLDKEILQKINIAGKITDQDGEPLEGVTVTSKKTGKGTISTENGEFTLNEVPDDDILIITSIGYNKKEIPLNKRSQVKITLDVAVGNLDATLVMAYGKTSKRLSTGNISKITSQEIRNQPVSSTLGALYGRVPGMVITQSSGLPGASFNIQIRGQNSLTQGSEPLFIIDGIPYAPNNGSINTLASILTAQNGKGLSPFANIDPSTIESIEILKDADATAIYGSRGANGVVLITTRKGKPGKTRLSVNINSGYSKVTRTMKMLSTKQYLQMRREAFNNDGITPSLNPGDPGYAPDLLIWDTTKQTDWQKEFLGGTANNMDANLTISGGSAQTQFLLGGSFHKETTIFPSNLSYNRGTINASVNHISHDKKLHIDLKSISSFDLNHLIQVSGPQFINTIPNAPAMLDNNGKLLWENKGVQITNNPYAALKKKYAGETENYLTNLNISYKITPTIQARVNIGYNSLYISEKNITPIAAQNPEDNPTGKMQLGSNRYKSWIVEPQAEYKKSFQKTNITLLVGASWQRNKQIGESIRAEGYTTDDLIESLSSAPNITSTNFASDYKYLGIFGRLTSSWSNKYLLNLSARRDGSSRFGPSKRFANFGAAGAAWIFTSEPFFRKLMPFISYGKIRGSYGITGNDQIGDYKYLDSWSSLNYSYEGTVGLAPTALFNNTYGWEVNRKLEATLDLGFFQDRILLSGTAYLNRSGNQLVSYTLPTQAGFPFIIRNFPALVQNTGLEFELTTYNCKEQNFSWKTSANISIPRNKLISFPGIESSSYASIYVEGQPLDVIFKLHSLGVNTSTGIFSFEDVNKDGIIAPGYNQDFVAGKGNLIKFYGGVRNDLTYKNFNVSILFEFRKQSGQTFLSTIYGQQAYVPGTMNNQPLEVMNRWQKPGDLSLVQKFTTISSSQAYQTASTFATSDGIYDDASYLRLKNISLSYDFSQIYLTKVGLTSCRLYLLAQNILTITNYKGADPEAQNFFSIPPLRTITLGISITL